MIRLGSILAIAILPAAPSLEGAGARDWYDGFEDYAAGESVAGQGIWQTWSGGTGTPEDALVSDEEAASGVNSLLIVGPNDTVAIFQDLTEGIWVVGAKVFVPSTMSGTLYFILMNRFVQACTGEPCDWSVQLQMSAAAGVIHDDLGGGTLPLALDEWAAIRVEIDLDRNIHNIFYNDAPLAEGRAWDDTGHRTIEAMDLYSGDCDGAFYDDVSLAKVCSPAAVERTVDPGSTALIEGVEVPAYVEGTPMLVTLTLSNVRKASAGCPDLGDVTIAEEIPEGWTATEISGGGTFANGTVTWLIPAADVKEGTLTYRASGPASFADVVITGTVTEEGNPHPGPVRGENIPAADGSLLSDGSIVRWLILGPYIQDVLPDPPIVNPTSAPLEQDFLSDGLDIFEDSVRPREGDRVATAFGAAAALRLAGPADGATRAGLNPGGIPTWFPWRDLDGIVRFDGPPLFGGDVNNAMAYAVCYLEAKEDLRDITIECGSNDGFQLLIDGEGLWTQAVYREWQGFTDIVGPLDLDAGLHILMLKIFEAAGAWEFGVRIRTSAGAPFIDGYTVCLNPEGCAHPPSIRFIRGDADGNGAYTIGDGIQILERQFSSRPSYASDCEETGDVDGNGILTIGDAVYLFNYLFAGGPRPADPAPACGTLDPNDLRMGCSAGVVQGCR